MPAGRYRNPFVVYAVTISKDADSGPTDTETTFLARWWGSLDATGGGEGQRGQQQSGDVLYAIEGHYVEGITVKHRLGLGTRRFDLLTCVNVGERNRVYAITARERV